jgi:transposase
VVRDHAPTSTHRGCARHAISCAGGFTRKRGELLSHIRNTFHHYNLAVPAGTLLTRKNREGVADRFTDPIVRRNVEADLQLCAAYDDLIRDLEKTVERHARDEEPQKLFLLQTIRGVGRFPGYPFHGLRGRRAQARRA